MTMVREPASNDCIGKTLSGTNPDTLLVKECTFAPLGNEHFFVRRIVDQTRHHGCFTLKRDGDCELWNAMQKVGGAIERIDDPCMGFVSALAVATFFTEKAITRPCLHQLGMERLFGTAIRGGHEIGRAFQRDLQFFKLA